MTIKVKSEDVEMLEAFLDQCGGEVVSRKCRKRRTNENESGANEVVAGEAERVTQPAPAGDPVQLFQASMLAQYTAVPVDTSSSNCKFILLIII